MRCADCKYFGKEIKGEGGSGFHSCEKILFRDTFGSKEEPVGAYVVDGSDYFAALRVPGDFGCLYFEAKQ